MQRVARRRRTAALSVVVVLLLGWVAYDYFSVREIETPVQDQSTVHEPGATESAIEALGRLAVREAASHDGYARDQFGSGWASVNGCDTRNLILQRDLAKVALDADKCTVQSGVLREDPYTGKTIQFKRGKTTSSAVQIDHVVALSNAWKTGAQDLSKKRRVAFANDSLNLLAVDGPANMQKGDSDAAEWLPRSEYRCRYVARQIAVKTEYKLWVTKAEHSTMSRVLGICPKQLLPVVQP